MIGSNPWRRKCEPIQGSTFQGFSDCNSVLSEGLAKAKDAFTPIRQHPDTSPGQREGKNANSISMQPRRFSSIVIALFKNITVAPATLQRIRNYFASVSARFETWHAGCLRAIAK
jgi:hypothetical protein